MQQSNRAVVVGLCHAAVRKFPYAGKAAVPLYAAFANSVEASEKGGREF